MEENENVLENENKKSRNGKKAVGIILGAAATANAVADVTK